MQFQPRRVQQLHITVEGIDYSFHEDLDGGIIATVANYPDCQAYGTDLEDALDSVQEALHAILEDLESTGNPVPDDLQAFLNARREKGL